jgi:predicted aconitase with swiveling domain
VAADLPTLNQNTSGTAANVTGTVAIINGGTGATTGADALIALGAQAANLSTDMVADALSTYNQRLCGCKCNLWSA